MDLPIRALPCLCNRIHASFTVASIPSRVLAAKRNGPLCLLSKNASRRPSMATQSGGEFSGAAVNANRRTGFPSSAERLTPLDERATVNTIR
jgi:hypothetical protein